MVLATWERCKPGQKVSINGASGGVGIIEYTPNSAHAGMGYIVKAFVRSAFVRQQGRPFVSTPNNDNQARAVTQWTLARCLRAALGGLRS
jgi:hypothetical protein